MTQTQRVQPTTLDQLDPQTSEIVAPLYEVADTKNVLMTVAKHPKLLQVWMPFTRYLYNDSELDFADIELICLRSTLRCGCEYEFSHHAVIALTRGLSQEQVDCVSVGSEADCFDDRQKLILDAVDQILDTNGLDDDTWQALSVHFSETQLIDLVVTCGNYATVSRMLNSLKVPLEAGISRHPAFA